MYKRRRSRCICIDVCIYIHACIICVCMYTHMCMYIYMCVYAYVYVYMYVYVYIYMYVRMHVNTYILFFLFSLQKHPMSAHCWRRWFRTLLEAWHLALWHAPPHQHGCIIISASAPARCANLSPASFCAFCASSSPLSPRSSR